MAHLHQIYKSNVHFFLWTKIYASRLLQIIDGMRHNRQSISWIDDFDSIKWVKRTAHFERKHRSLFLLLASGMVLIKNSQITVPVFNIQARSSELFNKRGAHCQMSILAGCICVSPFLPASTCCCSDWGTKSSESRGERSPMGERMLTFQTLCTCLLQKRERIMPSTCSFQHSVTQATAAILMLSSSVSGGETRALSSSKWIFFESDVIIDWI